MIQTIGKKNPEKEAKALKVDEIKAILDKRPKKKLENLTAKEKQEAMDAMLE